MGRDPTIPNFHLLPVSLLNLPSTKARSMTLLINSRFFWLPILKNKPELEPEIERATVCLYGRSAIAIWDMNKYYLRPDQWRGTGRNYKRTCF